MRQHKSNIKVPARDLCMTPGYALEPLIEGIRMHYQHTIWEPCCGEGHMALAIHKMMVPEFAEQVVGTTIEDGQDFFNFKKPFYDAPAIITNPPFSIRGKVLGHALQLCQRVAMLMPTETVSVAWFHKLVKEHGEPGIIWFSPRVNFKMPNKGWEGKGSHFPCAWFTWGWFTGQKFFHMDHWTPEYRRKFETDDRWVGERRADDRQTSG